MSTGRHDNEFDQTNGMVDGLEGDDTRETENGTDDGTEQGAGAVVGNTVNDAAQALFGGDDEQDGRTAEERDPAVTPTSEDERQ